LVGIAIGLCISIFYILRSNYRNNFIITNMSGENQEIIEITFSEVVTFINKGSILSMLNKLPANSTVKIDGSKCKAIEHDVLEIIQDFKIHASKNKNIQLILIDIPTVDITNSH